MIVPDTNLLIYAFNVRALKHEPARRWWEELVNGSERIGIPWVVTMAFLRLLTSRGMLATPIDPSQAVDWVTSWFEHPHVAPINPGSQHIGHMRRLLQAVGVGGNLAMDAHIAAIAIEYQAELHSNDADFARFPGLRWRNPL